MQHFTFLEDIAEPRQWVQDACRLKKNWEGFRNLGEGKTLGLVFLNPSLRTRMSTQIAAASLGMNVVCLDIAKDGWGLELEDGTVMTGSAGEHIKEAAAVMGAYCDIIGIRAFAQLKDREQDYSERIFNGFVKHAKCPILNLESATGHPLQALADYMTIFEHQKSTRPKVVLTWAPHCKVLPQAVPNSFADWGKHMEVELVITHPPGYELSEDVVGDTPVVYDQKKALQNADFVYAKNWSAFNNYGQILEVGESWTVDPQKMAVTRQAHFMHCLPVRRNLIVSDSVLDSPQSLVVAQAKNREHGARAVLMKLLGATL